MSIFLCNFAAVMKKIVWLLVVAIGCFACRRGPSAVEQHRAEKHERDSVALVNQQRSLEYYQAQLEELSPQADSLLALFKYEKNEKYQDHGYYVVKPSAFSYRFSELRVMVRDDGRDLLVYKEGKRLSDERVNELRLKGNEAVLCADHLQVTIADINELEKRIARTSLEVQKYQKRLQK